MAGNDIGSGRDRIGGFFLEEMIQYIFSKDFENVSGSIAAAKASLVGANSVNIPVPRMALSKTVFSSASRI